MVYCLFSYSYWFGQYRPKRKSGNWGVCIILSATVHIFIALQENVTYVLAMSEKLTEFLELPHDESYTKATKRGRRYGRVGYVPGHRVHTVCSTITSQE